MTVTTDRPAPLARRLTLDSGTSRRLTADRSATRLGWYSAQPAGLLTVITEFGRDRFDLLVVPPGATPRTADTALSAAADAGDNRRTPELLEAIEHTG